MHLQKDLIKLDIFTNKAKYIVLTMDNDKRACVVAAIAAISGQRNISSVYDYYMGGYIMFSVSISGNSVSVYDYSRGGYMQGSKEQVFDYVTSSYISINVNGNTFSGYDYGDGNYYSGYINSGSISFYDYEHNQYYNYFVS